MIKEAICTGETVEEAKEKALLELGAGLEEDVQIEVLATPKKKTLGLFGGSKAEVRVFVELPDPPAKKIKEEKKAPKKQPKQKKEVAVKAEEPKADTLPDAIPVDKLIEGTPSAKAAAYLTTVLKGLGVENFSMTAVVMENATTLNLEGEGLGVVIGRRGETLDALQYLTSLAAGVGNGYFRVNINIGGYRERREATLRSLAKRMSQQVIRTGRSRSLEPMNPYERRIIHTTVQSIDGVVSSSRGEGSARYVVIRPEGAPERDDYRARRSDRGGRPQRRINSNAVKVPVDPNREVKKDDEALPLYSKIN